MIPDKAPLTLAKLDELESMSKHFESRKQRASERLADALADHWHFALLGFAASFKSKSLGELGVIREVIEPPGEIELAGALKTPGQFGAVGRYSPGITHEISITLGNAKDPQFALDTGWWFISALRTKTLAEFLVPAVADHSWSVIAGISENKCRAQLLEDVPGARRLEPPIVVQEGDVDWVLTHLVQFVELLENPRFRLAVDALTTHQHVLSPRMMVASIWSGIEALLDVKAELRYRLSLLAAAVLEPQGKMRVECYRRMKKLYDERSKAVHGAALGNEELLAHVVEARRILLRMLCRMTEDRKVYSEEDFEAKLLGVDGSVIQPGN